MVTAESPLLLSLDTSLSWSLGFPLSLFFRYCSVLPNGDLTQVSSSQNHSAPSPVKRTVLFSANLSSLANFECYLFYLTFSYLVVSGIEYFRVF